MRRALALAAPALAAAAGAPTGRIVGGRWNGGTFPDVRWALDVATQTTEFSVRENVKLQRLIDTRPGNATRPSWTAYDAGTRTLLVTTRHNDTAAQLWALAVAADVQSAAVMGAPVMYALPPGGAALQGLGVHGGRALAFFQDCSVASVNWTDGNSRPFAALCGAGRGLTTAIAVNAAGGWVHAITDAGDGSSRAIAVLNLRTGNVTAKALQPVKYHDPTLNSPFYLQWLPTLGVHVAFYGGYKDQLVYIDPNTGALTMAVEDLSWWGNPGTFGTFQFNTDDREEDNDRWGTVAYDPARNVIHFLCDAFLEDDQAHTPTLCRVKVPGSPKMVVVDSTVQPMTYGFFGMQWVPVAA